MIRVGTHAQQTRGRLRWKKSQESDGTQQGEEGEGQGRGTRDRDNQREKMGRAHLGSYMSREVKNSLSSSSYR